MNRYTIREALEPDIDGLFDIRARTRENAISRERLAANGITPAAWAMKLRSGDEKTWVCFDGTLPVGFCGADAVGGEVVVLAVLPDYEGRGIGKELLERAVKWLQSRGCRRPWLATSPDPRVRSHGFYRSQGWQPAGERDQHGDEILVLERWPA